MKTKIKKNRRRRERRRSQRLRLNLPVEYRHPAKRSSSKRTVSQDISGGGLRLRLDYPLKKGSRLKTKIYFPDRSKPVTITSKVIWSKKSGKQLFDSGLMHEKIVPKDQERFVCDFCETMLSYFIYDRRRSKKR